MPQCPIAGDANDYTQFTFYVVPFDSDTHTHPFNGPLSGTTRVSRYRKGTTTVVEARDSEWQWHQLDHVQVCTLLHTDNHISTPLLSFFTGRMPFLTPNQQRQSIEGKFHSTQNVVISNLCIQMKGVRPSVCPSVPSFGCGPGGQDISIDCCRAGAQQQMRAVSRCRLT